MADFQRETVPATRAAAAADDGQSHDDRNHGTVPPAPSLPLALLEYFAIVGAAHCAPAGGAGSAGDGPPAAAGHPDAELSPVLLDRYPLQDIHSYALPTKLEWFCFPAGCQTIVEGAAPPQPSFSSFDLVGGTTGGSKVFGMCLTVHERRRAQSGWALLCALINKRLYEYLLRIR